MSRYNNKIHFERRRFICIQALIGESDDAGRLSSAALETLPNQSALETLQKVG